MKTVIYLDVLLLVNFLVAVFLLAGSGALCGLAIRPFRLLAAAGLAALSSLILLAPPLPLPLQLAWLTFSAACIVRVCFRWRGVRCLLRVLLWYAGANLLLSGAVVLGAMQGWRFVETNNLACYFGVSPALLFACVAGVYFFLRVLTLCFGRPEHAPLSAARIAFPRAAEPLRLTLYYDTGFSVEDPVTGKPAVLVYARQVRDQLAPELLAYLDAAAAEGALPLPPPGWGIRLLECRTVAGNALLPGIPASQLLLEGGGEEAQAQDFLVVLARGSPPDARYDGLFGPGLEQNLCWKEHRTHVHTENKTAQPCP
jgi:hypothetical protein